MENFTRHAQEGRTTDRLKLFAQLFRNSQRFLWYLSAEAGKEGLGRLLRMSVSTRESGRPLHSVTG
jgi:hypothetical protein